MLYALPGSADAKVQYKSRYDNFIGGKWVPPVQGRYFDNITPITGQTYCQAARSSALRRCGAVAVARSGVTELR